MDGGVGGATGDALRSRHHRGQMLGLLRVSLKEETLGEAHKEELKTLHNKQGTQSAQLFLEKGRGEKKRAAR